MNEKNFTVELEYGRGWGTVKQKNRVKKLIADRWIGAKIEEKKNDEKIYNLVTIKRKDGKEKVVHQQMTIEEKILTPEADWALVKKIYDFL